MAAPENIANSATPGQVVALTTLTKEVTEGATEIEVAAKPPASLEAAGQFHIVIGSEILLVTAGQTTTKWTVSRKQEGTTARAYANGTSVFHYLTKAALETLIGESGLVKTAGLASEVVTEPKTLLGSRTQSLITGMLAPCCVTTDGTFVYWGTKETNNIGCAKIDGTEINQELIKECARPHAILVHEGFIYWAQETGNTIGRATLAIEGGKPVVSGVNHAFISGCNAPKGIGFNEGFIFWTNHGGGTIGRATLAGTEVNQSFISGCESPQGTIAFIEAHMFWAEQSKNSIARATTAGGSVEHEYIKGCNNPVMGGTDGKYIYWSNFNSNTIARALPNGTEVNQSLLTECNGPQEGQPDALGHLWWANQTGNNIGRATLGLAGIGVLGQIDLLAPKASPTFTGIPIAPTAAEGDNSTKISTTAYADRAATARIVDEAHATVAARVASFITGGNQTHGIAVDATYIYWANKGNGTIGRAKLDGTEVNQKFIEGATQPRNVKVDAGHIYWGNWTANTVGRAAINGTEVNQSFITGGSEVDEIAIDATHIYWANRGTGKIGRATIAGAEVTQEFIIGGTNLHGLIVDAEHIYWLNETLGTIGRATIAGGEVTQSWITIGSTTSEGAGLGIDSEYIYWGLEASNVVGRSKLNGTSIEKAFITNFNVPCGVTPSGGYLYVANKGNGVITRVKFGLMGTTAVTRVPIEMGRTKTNATGAATINAPGVTESGPIVLVPEGAAAAGVAITARTAGTSFAVKTTVSAEYTINWAVYA